MFLKELGSRPEDTQGLDGTTTNSSYWSTQGIWSTQEANYFIDETARQTWRSNLQAPVKNKRQHFLL